MQVKPPHAENKAQPDKLQQYKCANMQEEAGKDRQQTRLPGAVRIKDHREQEDTRAPGERPDEAAGIMHEYISGNRKVDGVPVLKMPKVCVAEAVRKRERVLPVLLQASA